MSCSDLPRGARRVSAAAAATFVLALAACSSTPPAERDYLLAERPAAAVPAAGDLPALRVKALVARSFLDRKEIAWRQGEVLAGTYRYHRWSEPPAEMVTRALLDELRAGGRFAGVDGPAPRATAPWSVGGELLGLHEVAAADGSAPRGVAALEITVEALTDGGVARHWTLRAEKSVAATDSSLDALVVALSDAAAQAIREVARAIEATVAANRGG